MQNPSLFRCDDFISPSPCLLFVLHILCWLKSFVIRSWCSVVYCVILTLIVLCRSLSHQQTKPKTNNKYKMNVYRCAIDISKCFENIFKILGAQRL